MENLVSGEYQFVTSTKDYGIASFQIIIQFKVDANGNVTYDKPIFMS